jgi:hypothetical protein
MKRGHNHHKNLFELKKSQLTPQHNKYMFDIPIPFCHNLCQIFIQHFFKIVLHWCLDLICHNVGTSLKHYKHIFDIPLPFCHNLYLSANLKKFLTEFALKCQIFIQHFFKIVLYWCLDLICHNVGTPLKHNQYIFDIPIPFCQVS